MPMLLNLLCLLDGQLLLGIELTYFLNPEVLYDVPDPLSALIDGLLLVCSAGLSLHIINMLLHRHRFKLVVPWTAMSLNGICHEGIMLLVINCEWSLSIPNLAYVALGWNWLVNGLRLEGALRALAIGKQGCILYKLAMSPDRILDYIHLLLAGVELWIYVDEGTCLADQLIVFQFTCARCASFQGWQWLGRDLRVL